MSAVASTDRSASFEFGADKSVVVRKRVSGAMLVVFMGATGLAVVVLSVLLISVLRDGWAWLSWDLFTEMPSSLRAEGAGVRSALFGSIWVIALTALFAFPVGVGAAIYLEEYAPNNWWTQVLQVNIANLAGVPSVVYGMLGLGIFVEFFVLGRSIIAGALTLALLILPIIIVAGRESIRAVPLSLRQAAYGLGATKWQVTQAHVLPAALPGILTGTILAISRAVGETAPLLVAGAAGFVLFNPDSITDSYTVLPIQIYQWAADARQDFKELAAAGIVVLLTVLLSMNALAIFLRQRFSRTRW
jgi:phosphate transport system permease protein